MTYHVFLSFVVSSFLYNLTNIHFNAVLYISVSKCQNDQGCSIVQFFDNISNVSVIFLHSLIMLRPTNHRENTCGSFSLFLYFLYPISISKVSLAASSFYIYKPRAMYELESIKMDGRFRSFIILDEVRRSSRISLTRDDDTQNPNPTLFIFRYQCSIKICRIYLSYRFSGVRIICFPLGIHTPTTKNLLASCKKSKVAAQVEFLL